MIYNISEKMSGALIERHMKMSQRKINVRSKQHTYVNIVFDGMTWETIHNFTHLRSKIINDGKNHTDTVSTIA